MKKMISLIFALTVVILFATNSLYVEGEEFLYILASVSAISIAFILSFKERGKYWAVLGRSVMAGYVFFWGFALIDLLADNLFGSFLLSAEEEDGRALTLWEVIEEFSDDLFILSTIAAVAVLLISLVLIPLFSRFAVKND